MLQMSYILAVSQTDNLERRVSALLDGEGTSRGSRWRFWRR